MVQLEVVIPDAALEMMSRMDWSRYLGTMAQRNYDKFRSQLEMDDRLKAQGVRFITPVLKKMHELTEDPVVFTYY